LMLVWAVALGVTIVPARSATLNTIARIRIRLGAERIPT
jgi:hypothetical protein